MVELILEVLSFFVFRCHTNSRSICYTHYKETKKKGNYLQVYNNATSITKDGTSPENKLYYNSKTGKISGRIPNLYSQNSQRPYTVSQVRTSKALKRKKTRK